MVRLSDDVVVGSVSAGRDRPELEDLIGFFVNTWCYGPTCPAAPSFRRGSSTTSASCLIGGVAHQDLPFEMLVEQLHPTRDLSRNPLFQVTFQLFSSPTAPVGRTAPTDNGRARLRRGAGSRSSIWR